MAKSQHFCVCVRDPFQMANSYESKKIEYESNYGNVRNIKKNHQQRFLRTGLLSSIASTNEHGGKKPPCNYELRRLAHTTHTHRSLACSPGIKCI